MRTVRIYQEGPYSAGDTITLSPTASQHVATVLRMQPGEQLTLFPGNNWEYTATITEAQKKKVCVTLNTEHEINRESPCSVHLLQGISKGERMEFVVQKAVELGVASITPIITSRCVVRLDAERLLKKQAQWQAIAIAACEQSGRNRIPTLHAPCLFNAALSQTHTTTRLILAPDASTSWRQLDPFSDDITLVIGPEGGLSQDEIHSAVQANFQPLCLGPRILRTETAALAAISILQAVRGDL